MAAFVVPDTLDQHRADKILATVAGLSRSVARSLFDGERVFVDGRPITPSVRLPAGVRIEAEIPEVETTIEPDPSVPFEVVFESERTIVVDKPAGVVVHPGAGIAGGTLAGGLLDRFSELRDLPDEARWGIVHRLDRDTSGVLLVARDAAAHRILQDQLRRREIGRQYRALVLGTFDNATGTIEAPIGRDPDHPTRMAVVHDGRPAVTHYRRLATWEDEDVTLLGVTLETGRTHQIRVHMRAVGHPVVGDAKYGRTGVPGDPGRTWLHAVRIEFDDPTSGERRSVRSPVPPDLTEALATLGPPSRGSVPVD